MVDFTIRIEQDEHYESPRDWDNFGTMVCWHSRYNLGDEQPSEDGAEYLRNLAIEACPRLDEIIEYWENEGYDQLYEKYEEYSATSEVIEEHIASLVQWALKKHYLILPLYLYDHSGITMSTSRFSCPWDSGQVGFIYASLEDCNKEFGRDIEKATRCLVGEVETYDQYLTGDVWGYVIEDSEGEHVGSCWGFYGREYCEDEAKASAEYQQKRFDSIIDYSI